MSSYFKVKVVILRIWSQVLEDILQPAQLPIPAMSLVGSGRRICCPGAILVLELSVGNELCLALGESVQIYAADAIVPIILMWYFSRLIQCVFWQLAIHMPSLLWYIPSLSVSFFLYYRHNHTYIDFWELTWFAFKKINSLDSRPVSLHFAGLRRPFPFRPQQDLMPLHSPENRVGAASFFSFRQ